MRPDEALERLRTAGWLERLRPFFDILGGADGRTRAVGGIVRDTLLGLPRRATDIDMATELLPQEVAERARRAGLAVHPTGIDHGTVTLISDGQAVEVTTLRRDIETFGRQARVVFGTDWTEDARRRDFTMNALYCDADGRLADPLGGLGDCLAGRVRFIGDADARIAEDRLRVYRYFRFAASHGQQRFEADALEACRRAAGQLDALSRERVGSEMLRLLATPRCAKTLATMAGARIVDAEMFDAGVVSALEALETLDGAPSPVARLAIVALSKGNIGDLRQRWRLSNAIVSACERLVDGARLAALEQWAELGYRFSGDSVEAVAVAAAAAGRPQAWVDVAMAGIEPFRGAVFPIRGDDLIALGAVPGQQLGAELKRLEKLWLKGGCALDRAALLAAAKPGSR